MKNLFVALLIALSAISPKASADETEEISKAKDVAVAWLSILDAGKYGKSWDEASTFWKTDHTRQETENVLRDFRNPFGALKKRSVISAEFLRVPDGDLVSFQFSSQFENNTSIIETVELLREKNGEWKVSLWAQRNGAQNNRNDQ